MGALHLAKYGASGVARLLLARGAQPDAPGKSHITPLHMATYYGHPDIALLLLDKGRKFILGVTKQQSWKEVKRGERSPTRLARATSLAKYGASGVARLLLARGAQPDAPGKSHITPLHMATYYGHPDIALLLLDKGKNVKKESPTRLARATSLAKYGASGVARLLLARGAQPDAPGKSHITPLHMATYYGHPDIALLLLDKGKNVKKESEERSPTRLARATSLAKYGASGVARLLLARGAQPDAPGKSHITPLHMATYYGHPDIALLLLDKGKNVKKESPTRLARATSLAKYGASGVARLLLARGAQPDAPGKSHITPLHMATYYGHPDIALLLLDKGRKFILGVTKQQIKPEGGEGTWFTKEGDPK
ncbi:hypothetical protein NE865_10822 [Phthorimaea operculella]|nr:hypothetical protein NE865_10822 [Phthorimaea operculella]